LVSDDQTIHNCYYYDCVNKFTDRPDDSELVWDEFGDKSMQVREGLEISLKYGQASSVQCVCDAHTTKSS